MAVIGLPDPKPASGACAVVVPEGRRPTRSTLARAVRAFLQGQGLMMQKLPEQLEIVDVLPRNPTGKVLKHELRSTYSS